MAGIVTTIECRCCHRQMPLDKVIFDEYNDTENEDIIIFAGWLCEDSRSCLDYVRNRTQTHNDIVILNGLLDSIDKWLFNDQIKPKHTNYTGWDATLARLAMNIQYANQTKLDELIKRMQAKGMDLAAKMLKDSIITASEDD